MRRPTFLIVTINLNNADGLFATLSSIRKQNYTGYISVVIDGGSTDKSKKVVNSFSDIITSFISEPDEGIYDAMNKGIKASPSQHDYVLFLNSGDIFSGQHILSLVAQAIEASCIWPDAVYGHTLLKSCNTINKSIYLSKARRLSYIQCNIPMHHQSIYFKRESLGDPPYDTSYQYAGDTELVARMYSKKCSFHFIDYPLSIFDTTGSSFKPEVQAKSYVELARIRTKYFKNISHLNPLINCYLNFVSHVRQKTNLFSLILRSRARLVNFMNRLFLISYKGLFTLRFAPQALFPGLVTVGVEHRDFMLSVAGEVNCVIDVGMNRGQFLLAALHWLSPSQYVGFEPIPYVYNSVKCLLKKIAIRPKATLYNLALSDTVKLSKFYLSQKTDCSSLLKPVANSLYYNSKVECKSRINLMLSTLDTVLAPPNQVDDKILLKIDTQGTELTVLRGARELLKSGVVKHIYVEVSEIIHYHGQCHFLELLDYLNSFNFNLIAFYNTNFARDGRLVYADAHFALVTNFPPET